VVSAHVYINIPSLENQIPLNSARVLDARCFAPSPGVATIGCTLVRSSAAEYPTWLTSRCTWTRFPPECLHQQPLEIPPSVMAAWLWRYVVQTWRLTAHGAAVGAGDTPSARRSPFRGSDLQVRHNTGCATRIPLGGALSFGATRADRQPHPALFADSSSLQLLASRLRLNRYTEILKIPVSYRKHRVGVPSNRYTDEPIRIVIPSEFAAANKRGLPAGQAGISLRRAQPGTDVQASSALTRSKQKMEPPPARYICAGADSLSRSRNSIFHFRLSCFRPT